MSLVHTQTGRPGTGEWVDVDVVGYSKVSGYTGILVFLNYLNAGSESTTYYYSKGDALLLAPENAAINLSYWAGSSLSVYFQVLATAANNSVTLRLHWYRSSGTSSTLSGTNMNITAMFF